MAAAKPIVTVLNGEVVEVIKEADCGWTLSSGDTEGLGQLAIGMSRINEEVLAVKGDKSKKSIMCIL